MYIKRCVIINMNSKSKFWILVVEILVIVLQVSAWGSPCTEDQTMSPQEYQAGTGCFCDGVIRPFIDSWTNQARWYTCMNHKTTVTNSSSRNQTIKSTSLTNVSVTCVSTSMNLCFILVVLCCLSTFI